MQFEKESLPLARRRDWLLFIKFEAPHDVSKSLFIILPKKTAGIVPEPKRVIYNQIIVESDESIVRRTLIQNFPVDFAKPVVITWWIVELIVDKVHALPMRFGDIHLHPSPSRSETFQAEFQMSDHIFDVHGRNFGARECPFEELMK